MTKLLKACALVVILSAFAPALLRAQCGAGTTQAELNWDHIDFLPSNNVRYTDFYPNSSFPYTQSFSMGTRKVRFQMAPQANIVLNGENQTNTAHGDSPDVTAGADVQFTTTTTSNTTITFTFDEDVQNLRFSLFDLDNSQRAIVTATNGAGTALPVTMAKANTASTTTITTTATSATAASTSGDLAATNTRGSINISIAGPVRRVVITLNNAAGDIWLSDIDACLTGNFPTDYRIVSRPFTGQPQYVVTVVNNNIYYTNPVNGQSYFLFNEPAHNRLNSLAYDPYRRRVYYTFSLSGGSIPRTDKTVRVYDVDSKTISILIDNVNDYGIPTYESGVESGAACFYNGSLYLGIEGYTNASYAAARKSTVWRIDFDASGNPIMPASQVWGVLADNGTNSQNIHDWSDFGVVDGKLIDFDGSGSGDYDYFHFDLMSGAVTEYTPVGAVPRQVAVGWDEKLYNVNNVISLYNGTTSQGTEYTITAPLGPVIPTGSAASWGDAAGPYRPFLDFGDAPASYDPDPLSPACHDTLTPNISGRRSRMILGDNEDVEWLKRGFTTTEDNFEDGLEFVPVYSLSSGNYIARVKVLNTTNLNATVCAWLDFNGNGVFDIAEGITPVTVAPSASTQLINLEWPTVPALLSSGDFTYLRIRITKVSNNMNRSNATGYYDMGEVEDYRVVVTDFPLPIQLINFDVNRSANGTVQLQWKAEEDTHLSGYEIQRSLDAVNFSTLRFVPASGTTGNFNYTETDPIQIDKKYFYRLRLVSVNAAEKFSQVKWVEPLLPVTLKLLVAPNPVKDQLRVQVLYNGTNYKSSMQVLNMSGQVVWSNVVSLSPGNNRIDIPSSNHWPNGMYLIRLQAAGEIITNRFSIQR